MTTTSGARVVASFAGPTFVVECDRGRLPEDWDDTDLLYPTADDGVLVRAGSAEDALRYVQGLVATETT